MTGLRPDGTPERYTEEWARRQIRKRILLAFARVLFCIVGIVGWAILLFGGDFQTGVILILCCLTWLTVLIRG